MIHLAFTDEFGDVIEPLTDDEVQAISYALERTSGNGDEIVDALNDKFWELSDV